MSCSGVLCVPLARRHHPLLRKTAYRGPECGRASNGRSGVWDRPSEYFRCGVITGTAV